MNHHKRLSCLNSLVVLAILCSCSALPAHTPVGQAAIASDSIANVIAKYRQEIPVQMQAENIPGLAIAIVDGQGILWEESFGYTDWDRQTAVTPATLFSIQSMSKSFTATAAMFAAQDGLVDLDAPITTYLPDFHIHSIFEEHPEQKMTLRILLSHTAGFPHDTAYGGNFDNSPYNFEQHIASISDTWLMFPVGTRYSYSNIGIDLAGYILQARSGMPFTQYVQEKVLAPLGMKDSTLEYQQVRAATTRAIGHVEAPLRPPVDFMLIPSGGVWTSTEDMARYLQFHINKGALEGARLLREDLAETMYTPPNLAARGAFGDGGYALGITVSTRNGARHFQHGGGGFGYNSSMVWYPDLKLGSVVLTNKPQEDSYYYTLSEAVLDDIITENSKLYVERASSAGQATPAYLPFDDVSPLSDQNLRAMIASKALPEDAAAQSRRSAAAGKYILTAWGLPADTLEVQSDQSKLTVAFMGQNEKMTEVEAGLYFAPLGQALDLRGPTPMIDNIGLVKANDQILPFQLALYAICGLAFLSALLFWPVRAIYKRIRKQRNPGQVFDSQDNRWLVGTGILAGLAALAGLACLAAIALVPNLIYVPWPLPYADLSWWQFALLSLPFIGLGLGVASAILAGLSLKSGASRGTQGYYLALALTLLAFNLTLLLI